MEESSVIPNSESYYQKELPQNKKGLFLTFVGLILLCLLVVGAYFLGKANSGQTASISPTPQLTIPTLALSPTSGEPFTQTVENSKNQSPSPTPPEKSIILNSTRDLDGFTTSSDNVNESLEIKVGRNSEHVARGFVGFDLTELQQGVTVTNAILRVFQANASGNPYSAGGTLKLDHLDFGDSLDTNDYSLPALTSSFTTLSTNPSEEWKEADVTDYLKSDLAAARSRSQFRLHFQTEVTGGNVDGDFVAFESADNSIGTGNTPQLVVKYR